jgi:hypothetical protein
MPSLVIPVFHPWMYRHIFFRPLAKRLATFGSIIYHQLFTLKEQSLPKTIADLYSGKVIKWESSILVIFASSIVLHSIHLDHSDTVEASKYATVFVFWNSDINRLRSNVVLWKQAWIHHAVVLKPAMEFLNLSLISVFLWSPDIHLEASWSLNVAF